MQGRPWLRKVLFGHTLLAAGVGALFLPHMRLFFFAPYLIFLVYRLPLASLLWVASGIGLLLDVTSNGLPLGFYALLYASSVALIYPQRRHFFVDKLSTLPVVTFLLSCLISLLQVPLLFLSGFSPHVSWRWVMTDVVGMGLADGLYALVWFAVPLALLRRTRLRLREGI